MQLERVRESWSNSISIVTIGATPDEGGSRESLIKIGGENTLPFLHQEGDIPHSPVIAAEIWDIEPVDWPEELKEPFNGVLGEPVKWAKKWVEDFKIDLLALRLQGAHPDSANRSPEEASRILKDILKAVSVPLIVLGCGDDTKDNLILAKCSEVAKGERILFGSAVQDNYKTLTACCLADGHNIIAESPIDINIAKQLNILITEMGLPIEKVVINPTVGALGYGLEYAYSIMERARLAALSGDRMMPAPFICFVGQEGWRVKEKSIIWEIITATSFLQSGVDILVMRHPEAVKEVKKTIAELMKK